MPYPARRKNEFPHIGTHTHTHVSNASVRAIHTIFPIASERECVRAEFIGRIGDCVNFTLAATDLHDPSHLLLLECSRCIETHEAHFSPIH